MDYLGVTWGYLGVTWIGDCLVCLGNRSGLFGKYLRLLGVTWVLLGATWELLGSYLVLLGNDMKLPGNCLVILEVTWGLLGLQQKHVGRTAAGRRTRSGGLSDPTLQIADICMQSTPKRHDLSPLSAKSRERIAGIQQSIFWRLDFVHRCSVSSTSRPRIAAIYMQSVPRGPRSLAPVDKIEGTDCWIAGSSEEG